MREIHKIDIVRESERRGFYCFTENVDAKLLKRIKSAKGLEYFEFLAELKKNSYAIIADTMEDAQRALYIETEEPGVEVLLGDLVVNKKYTFVVKGRILKARPAGVYTQGNQKYLVLETSSGVKFFFLIKNKIVQSIKILSDERTTKKSREKVFLCNSANEKA